MAGSVGRVSELDRHLNVISGSDFGTGRRKENDDSTIEPDDSQRVWLRGPTPNTRLVD